MKRNRSCKRGGGMYNGRLWQPVMVVRLAGEEEVVETGVAIAS